MVTYNDTLAMFVRYDGTKAAFEDVKSSYLGKIVFIYGSKNEVTNQEGLVQAIWVSDENGGRYLDMANLSTVKEGLSHIDGLAFLKDGSTTQYDTYDLAGGKGFAFKGANGITVKLIPSPVTTVDNKPYWAIEIDGNGIISSLVGTSPNNSTPATHPNTITGAKAYADKLAADIKGTKDTGDTTDQTVAGAKDYADAKVSDAKTELKGTKATGDTTAETIRGAKDYADKVAASKASTAKDEAIQASKDYVDPLLEGKADLENGKIKESQLPDYIFGQMLFGGTITAGGANAMEVSPSSKLLDKVDKPSTTSSLTINKTEASTYEGAYFIVTGNLASVFGLATATGDWIVSTGADWRKVDNTDAVSSVAELTGVITASALAKKLAETNDANELALKSEVDAKYAKPDGGVPEGDLSQDVQTKLNRTVNIGGSDYIDVKQVTEGNKLTNEISAKTKTIKQVSEEILLEQTGKDALTTAYDVYAFIKARLSIKIVSQQ